MNKKSTKALASATLMSLVLTTALTAGPAKAAATSATRVSGSDRYETAANVATKNWTTSDNVVLVSGQGYADAVSASALAKQLNAPILLTTPDTLSASTSAALTKLQAKNIYVIGGNASVSQSVRDQLKKSYTLTELSGNTRYETNVAVANELVKLGVKKDNVLVVGGNGFSDALSVAPIASAKGEILLLADNSQSDSKGAIDFANGSNVTVVGTSNVISDAIKNDFSTSAKRVNGGSDRFATNLNVLSAFSSDLKADKLYVANASGNGYADALVASAIAGKTASPLVLVDTDTSDATTNALAYIDKEATPSTDVEVVGGTGVISDALLNKIGHTTSNTSAEVQSISANGLRQIKVVFNQAVDQDTAEDISNYTVDGADLTDKTDATAKTGYDKAVLQDDDKTVLITLKDARKQSDNVDVKVKKGILSKDKSQTVPEFTQSVSFDDTTAPTVKSVSPKGNKKITVEFSEPINVGTSADASGAYSKFKINGKNISGFGLDSQYTTAKDAVYDGKDYWTNKIDFYFDTALDTGNNTLKISDADSSALEDAAGFPVEDTTQDFNIDTLTTKPQITSITAEDSGKIYINFDRPMDEKTAKTASYYEINGASQSDVTIDLKKDDTQVKISGVTGLNKNSNKLYIKNNVKDAYGNNVEDDTYESFDLTEDTVKPAVNSVSALDDSTIRVRFSKDVDTSFAKSISNYKLQDNSGTDITSKISEIKLAGGKDTDKTGSVFDISLKDGEKLTDSKYTMTIKNVRDTASTPNVMDDYTTTFDGSSDVNAEVTGVYGVSNSDGRKVTLTFNKEMDSSTLDNVSNYKYYNEKGDTKVVPSSSDISVSSDNKSVTIQFPDSYTYVDQNGTIGNPSITSKDNQVTKVFAQGVKDKDGNELEVGNYGGTIQTATAAGTTTVKENSIRLYYDNDDLKADIGFTNPIDSESVNSNVDFYLAGIKADSANVNGSKLTLTFNSNDDNTTAVTNINKIKAAGLDAKLTMGSATGTTSSQIKDVMGAYVGTGSVNTTPYYYDAAPRTIVLKDSNDKSTNWKANVSGTTATVTTVFDTPIDANSVKTGDFNFAVNGTSLTPDKAEVSGDTVVFTFDTTKQSGNKTYGDYFTKDSTITVTPNTDAKTISTKEDRNDGYAYYTPSTDDNKGIKIVITGDNASTLPTATIESTGTAVPGQTVVVASLPSGVDATKYDITINGTTLTYNTAKNKFVGTISGTYSDPSKLTAVVSAKQASTTPVATIESTGTAVPGQTVVVASLPSGTDATKYDITINGTTLTYNAAKNKFVGTISGTYSDPSKLTAVVSAK